jgi:hypothetical protein
MKNEGFIERGIQLTISALIAVTAIFWLSGIWAWVAGIFSVVILVFAIVGFCPLYFLFKIKKENLGQASTIKVVSIITIYLVALIGGGYASNFFSKKFFVEDFNAMNNYYKQALFETGQEKRPEAIANYDLLVSGFANFKNKYTAYQPYALRNDKQFISDLENVDSIISKTKTNVYSGNLKDAHLSLEKVRPITQEMFKRNGFSMLAIALVDFHDSMEKVLDMANAKNYNGVIDTYTEASEKLSAVEKEANDTEIQVIRKNLDEILSLAREKNSESLPAKAAELKSSFVKVYLKRG